MYMAVHRAARKTEKGKGGESHAVDAGQEDVGAGDRQWTAPAALDPAEVAAGTFVPFGQ